MMMKMVKREMKMIKREMRMITGGKSPRHLILVLFYVVVVERILPTPALGVNVVVIVQVSDFRLGHQGRLSLSPRARKRP